MVIFVLMRIDFIHYLYSSIRYALPVVTDMALDLGFKYYQTTPFNGWYVCTEIGVRNLGDEKRYNMLPTIASRMGLDINKPRTLW